MCWSSVLCELYVLYVLKVVLHVLEAEKDVRRDALCATLYAGRAGDAGGDALCATLYAGRAGRDACVRLYLLEVVEVAEVMHVVLLCMLEVIGRFREGMAKQDLSFKHGK